MGLERTLHAHTMGNFANSESRVQTALATGNHHTFVSLQALAGTFLYSYLYDNGVARGQVRNVFLDRKSTRLNSSHVAISYAVFCLKKKKKNKSNNKRE